MTLFWYELEPKSERVAFRDGSGGEITYAELARSADLFADLPQGSLLLLSLDNSIASMVAYVGALRLGLPAIIVDAADHDGAARLASRFRPGACWSPATGLVLLRQGGDHPATHPDLAVLLSTSGTTGATKLVRLSAAAVDANARSIAQYLALDAEERAITTLPPCYSYGLSVINSHLAAGATTILYDGSVLEPRFRELLEAQRATSLAGVPYTYELLERVGFVEALPPSIRTLTQAGGRLPPERAVRVATRARAAGARFFMMYGQTEAVARMAFLPPSELPENADCIGRPVPGGRFDLIDPLSGAPTVDAGELVYFGPNLMMGYAEEASDLSRGHELDRLHTGDLAERLPCGLYRITGRKSRFTKMFGLRIGLDEVERTLAAEGIDAVAAGDDQLLAVSVADEEWLDAADKILDARFGLPRSHYVVLAMDAMPRLASGKVDYRGILEAGRAERDRELCRSDSWAGGPESGALRAAFAEALNRKHVDAHDSFQSLAGDSLSYVHVSMAVEDMLGHLPGEWETLTIGEIEALATGAEVDVKRPYRWLATDVLVRPLAMTLILAAHLLAGVWDDFLQGGALTLLILAGFNFHRFQRERLLSSARASVVASFFTRFIIPYYGLLALYGVLTNSQVGVPSLLLVNNIWRDPGMINMAAFWFIQALFHCVVACVLLFSVPAVRQFAARREWSFGFLLLAFALLIKGAALVAGGPRSAEQQLFIASTDAWAYAFALGWLISQADSFQRRLTAIGVTYACTGLDWGFADSHALIATGAVAAMLFVPRVRLWSPAAWTIAFLAQATFFIYLGQGIAFNIVYDRLGIQSVAVNLLGAAVLGSIGYLGWQHALGVAHRWAGLLRAERAYGLTQQGSLWARLISLPTAWLPTRLGVQQTNRADDTVGSRGLA